MSHLQYIKLKDCCDVVGGSTPKRNVPEYWQNDIPWVTPKDISSLESPFLNDAPEYISKKGYNSCSTSLLPKNSILLTSRAPIGNVAIAGREMCTNQGFKSLIPHNGVDFLYLYYCIKHNSSKLQALGNGATFKEVSKKIVEDFEIPLPLLEEQKRIAAILDKADAVRRKRQQAIQLSEQLLRSVFLDMFGDPFTNSKGFKLVKISDIGEIITGNTPSREKKQYYGSEIEWIKSDNINTPFHYLTKADEYLSEEGKLVGRYAPEDSVLITCIAGSKNCIGNIAMTDREVAFNQQINAVIPNEKTLIYFLYAQLFFNKKIIQNASTNSMKGMVSKSRLSNIEILFPPIAEQEKYAQFFSKALKKIQKDNLAFMVSDKFFNSLTQRAFRGELSKKSNIELA